VKRSRASPAGVAVIVVVVAAGGFFVWRMRASPNPHRRKDVSSADGRPLGDVRGHPRVAPDDTEEEGASRGAETLSDEREFSIEYQSRWKTASYRLVLEGGYRDSRSARPKP
jgi:hypothetical protein